MKSKKYRRKNKLQVIKKIVANYRLYGRSRIRAYKSHQARQNVKDFLNYVHEMLQSYDKM
ncbi:hypothetical protein CIG11343_0789 [Campylobacter iguaniorum]|nr:hypothetical protein CIG11343_0647 [Campylobacter iguaniorum]ANE35826.1 hypothetical protein CIG11343_0789 [Campylobacter iguaniorum]